MKSSDGRATIKLPHPELPNIPNNGFEAIAGALVGAVYVGNGYLWP